MNLFDVLGDLAKRVSYEDNAIALRSILAGGLCYLPQRLVKYRVHANNVFVKHRQRVVDMESLVRQEDRLRRGFRNRETMYAGFLKDLARSRELNLITPAIYEAASAEAERGRRRFKVM